MQFLNSAFDSSTFIRTNYNYIHSLAMLANGGPNATSNALPLSTSSYSANSSMANVNSSITGIMINTKPSSFILPSTSNSATAAAAQSLANTNNNISSSNTLLATAKSSISTNHHGGGGQSAGGGGGGGGGGVNGSVSSKTAEGRALWLQHLAAAAANASSKRTYCSKTQVYCEAISRALDIHTCRVVPFFGAFLHDLRFIIESVPSIAVMCNTIVQKPIEVINVSIFCTVNQGILIIMFFSRLNLII